MSDLGTWKNVVNQGAHYFRPDQRVSACRHAVGLKVDVLDKRPRGACRECSELAKADAKAVEPEVTE